MARKEPFFFKIPFACFFLLWSMQLSTRIARAKLSLYLWEMHVKSSCSTVTWEIELALTRNAREIHVLNCHVQNWASIYGICTWNPLAQLSRAKLRLCSWKMHVKSKCSTVTCKIEYVCMEYSRAVLVLNYISEAEKKLTKGNRN